MNALPSPQLGTHLDNESFRVSVSLRLGGNICQNHRCRCGEEIDTKGLHGLKCKKSSGRFSRHAAVNDLIHRALKSGDVPSILEPVGCNREDGKRPDGMSLIPWKNGRCILWDFTCVDTFAPSYVSSTSIIPGSAADEAEKKKEKKYATLTSRFIFMPVGIETSGVFGKRGLQFLKKIGHKIIEKTGEKRATNFLLQSVSIAVQRGNVSSILGSIPSGSQLNQIFYL